MSVFFTPHARARALERYGIELTSADMAEILRATKDGRAQLLQSTPEGGRIFVWMYRERLIVPALYPDQDFIMTFMPSDFFLKSSRHEHKEATGVMSVGGRRKARRGNAYRRGKSNRHALTDVEE